MLTDQSIVRDRQTARQAEVFIGFFSFIEQNTTEEQSVAQVCVIPPLFSVNGADRMHLERERFVLPDVALGEEFSTKNQETRYTKDIHHDAEKRTFLYPSNKFR